MLSRLSRFLRAAPLPATGSLARDLLAAERTFLAWSRTGLGSVALGVALAKVEALQALAPAPLTAHGARTRAAAGALVASGAGCVALATRRYFRTVALLQRGQFRPNAAGVTATAAVMVGVALAGAGAVLEDGESGGASRGDGRTV